MWRNFDLEENISHCDVRQEDISVSTRGNTQGEKASGVEAKGEEAKDVVLWNVKCREEPIHRFPAIFFPHFTQFILSLTCVLPLSVLSLCNSLKTAQSGC
jgi:hypothetical protein